MSKKLKKHASLRGVSKANDEANQLTEFQRGHSTSVTTLTDFAALNRLGCRAHIRSLAMTQCAFTMAEILLSLTIIGVVAAITLPSLMANINERTWNTQRRALYARMSQAIAMMPQLNGYGEYEGTNTDGSVTATKDTAAEAFLTEGLSKVLKINNICDAAHLADCGIATSYTALNGSAKTLPTKLSELNAMFTSVWISLETGNSIANSQNHIDTKAAAFETQNGENIVVFYNPECLADAPNWRQVQTRMCVNFIYDLNGNKGPNTVGKDIGFMTAFYSVEPSVVAPMPVAADLPNQYLGSEVSGACLASDAETRLPNRDELASLWVNADLAGMSVADANYHVYWTGNKYSPTKTWIQNFQEGDSGPYTNEVQGHVRCVKR